MPKSISYRVRNAYVHLKRAWALHPVDAAMSLFRAITAEEEAATGLMLALKMMRYPGAERLRHKDHVFKHAFWPLIRTVSHVMHGSGIPAPKMVLSTTGKPDIRLRFNMSALIGGSGDGPWAEPDQPLNFSLQQHESGGPVFHMFAEQFAELASQEGTQSIRQHVEAEANLRNRLLYSGDEGMPLVRFEDAVLVERARRVGVLASLTIIILQSRDHQIFAVQCLEALLRALERFGNSEPFDYLASVDSGPRPLVTLRREGLQPGTIAVTKTVAVGIRWDGIRSLSQIDWPNAKSAYSVGFD